MDYYKHRVADKGCKISRKTKTSLKRWDCGATGSSMGKDSKWPRKMKEGCFLQWKNTAWNRIGEFMKHTPISLLTFACIWILLSSLIWKQTKATYKLSYLFKWPWSSLKVSGLQNNWKFCNCSVVQWHEVAKTSATVDYMRKMAAEKSSKYGEYGSFEPLLFSCCYPLVNYFMPTIWQEW